VKSNIHTAVKAIPKQIILFGPNLVE